MVYMVRAIYQIRHRLVATQLYMACGVLRSIFVEFSRNLEHGKSMSGLTRIKRYLTRDGQSSHNLSPDYWKNIPLKELSVFVESNGHWSIYFTLDAPQEECQFLHLDVKHTASKIHHNYGGTLKIASSNYTPASDFAFPVRADAKLIVDSEQPPITYRTIVDLQNSGRLKKNYAASEDDKGCNKWVNAIIHEISQIKGISEGSRMALQGVQTFIQEFEIYSIAPAAFKSHIE